jgi:hypothetical protein
VKPLKKFKQRLGRYLLKKRISNHQREKAPCNFHTAETVGIIVKLDGDPKQIDQVKEFMRFISDKKNKVYALAYFDGKKIPSVYSNPRGINIFTKKDLNWYYIPTRKFLRNFMKRKLDLLIDLSDNDSFPVKYITSLSDAKFKVGKFEPKNEQYDMMIQVDKNTRLEYIIDQMKHYISNINK